MIRVMGLHTKEVTMSSHEMKISYGEKQSTLLFEPMHLACVHSTEDLKNSVHLVLAIDWYGLCQPRGVGSLSLPENSPSGPLLPAVPSPKDAKP